MVSLPGGMRVKWLEVDSPARLAIFLFSYNYPMAPLDGFT